MEIEKNTQINEETILQDLERLIKINHFSSKAELSQYLKSLRNGKVPESILTNEKIQELLDLYDSLTKKEEFPLDTQKYSSIGMESQDLIVAKETDQVLKTLEGTSAFNDEFKKTQNMITANKEDGLANADTVFGYMANHQKEEVKLVSLIEALNQNNIDVELLNKIKFFITNKYINPYIFKINIENGLFYNIQNNEVYEVIKNIVTQEYEIYKAGEKVYTAEEPTQEHTEEESKENIMSPQVKSNNKVRRLVPQKPQYNNRAAFTKISFLVINIITFTLLVTMILLLNK